MSQDGFATFISDDLPGFNSLNGSGFFDTACDWNDLSDSDENGFGGDALGFEVVRAAHTEGDDTKKEVELDLDIVFSDDEDEEEDEEEEDEDGGSLGKVSAHKDENAASNTTKQRSKAEKSSRRKPTSSPSDKQRRVRRHGSTDTAGTAENSVASASSKQSAKSTRSSASQQLRRARTTGNDAPISTRRASTAACRARRRSEHLKKSGLDLGAKLDKLAGEKKAEAETPAKKAVACDDQSVGSRHSVSSKSNAGRRGDRRRRATQGSELLARNLQQFTAASTLVPADPYRHTLDDSLQGGKEEAWKSRRRRAENLAVTA